MAIKDEIRHMCSAGLIDLVQTSTQLRAIRIVVHRMDLKARFIMRKRAIQGSKLLVTG